MNSKQKEMEYIYRDNSYDRVMNSEGRSIVELSPIGFRWNQNAIQKEILFSSYGFACSLRKIDGFCVVDIDNNGVGSAFLIDYHGNRFYVVSNK